MVAAERHLLLSRSLTAREFEPRQASLLLLLLLLMSFFPHFLFLILVLLLKQCAYSWISLELHGSPHLFPSLCRNGFEV